MFKFMKSKKGFSLVELMIVVVIMAILVAVAVPIYNSVTGNSRAKTCIDNQRQIISVLTNDLMLNAAAAGTQTFYVVNNDTLVGYSGTADGTAEVTKPNDGYYGATELATLFQTVPYCPADDSSIEVEITVDASGACTIATDCDSTDTDNPHELTGA